MSSPYAIGLDVGGTKIAGGIVAQSGGQVILRRVVPTEANRGGEAVLETCINQAKLLLAEAKARALPIAGIGLGLPELVDLASNVTDAYNFDWRGLDIPQAFAHIAPAVVESDVRAHAWAEATFGAGQDYRLFAYVTVGTGISYCLMQDGRPYAGARGNAISLASAPLTATCPACGVTSHPVLEEFASGPALIERYNQASGQSVTRGQDVFAAVEAGDSIAIQVVTSAAESLGVSVGFLINVLDPEAVIVGGGLGLAGGLYWETFMTATRDHIYAANARDLPIMPAALGNDAGLIGAATTVFQKER